MYVCISGKGKSKVVQFVEQHRILGTKKKKNIVIKTIGNYEKLLQQNPNIIQELKQEAKRLTQEKKQANTPITITIENQIIQKPQDTCKTLHIGHCLIMKLWNDMNMDACLKKYVEKKNIDSIRQAIKALLIHRLSDPKSILSSQKDLQNYAGIQTLGLDVYYQALDILAQYKEPIINHLCKFFENKTDRKGPVAYYDVTTYAFESVRQGELRMFGFSKDNKNKEVQVVMGLLLDNNAIPITFELFPGNTMDQNTLEKSVQSLKEKYNLEKIVIVADRGLNGKDNLEYLVKQNHDFVIGFTLKKSTQEIKRQALEEKGWKITKQSPEGEILLKEKSINHILKVKVELTDEEIKNQNQSKKRGRKKKYKEIEIQTKLHITWSQKRYIKDKTDRQRIIEKAQQLIEKPYILKSNLKKGRNQYINFEVNTEKAQINQEKINTQQQYDGYYAIITNNLEYTTKKVSEMYAGLWQIEESFRILKTDLKSRPVYVWTDTKIHGHFTLCYIALSYIRYMQNLLKKQEKTNLINDIKESINKPKVIVEEEKEQIYLRPFGINQTFLDLSEILQIKPMTKIMRESTFKRITKLDIKV